MKKVFSLKTLAPTLLAAYVVLRLFHNQFENDELQHLHVVWSWTRGLIQYKDIFDNHAPLYQLLAAGALYATGAGASSGWLILARFLTLPAFAALLAAVYRIARTVFALEPDEALLTACLLGLTSPFLAMSARPEPLWLLFFFLSLLILSDGKPGAGRGFLAGLVNGAGAMVSLKTLVLLLPAQALGEAAAWFFYPRKPDRKFLPAFAAGLVLVPALVALYFMHLDALREMFYYTVTYNADGAPFHLPAARALLLAAALAAAGLLLRLLGGRVGRGLFFFIFSAASLGLLLLIYPVMEHQTVLPLRLMLYTLGAALLVKEGGRRLPQGLRGPALFSFFCALLIFQLCNTRALKNENSLQRAYIDRILSLTGESDYVMDAKGESVFRRRPFYYGLELLAMRGMAAGKIADDIPEKARATATKLVLLWFPGRFTPKDLAFFRDNYLPLASPFEALSAAGKEIIPDGGKAGFDIAIPADYAAFCSGGEQLTLDGRRYTGPSVRLEAGRHTASAGKGCGRIELIWAKAAAARPA
jgi:hypothetical protein